MMLPGKDGVSQFTKLKNAQQQISWMTLPELDEYQELDYSDILHPYYCSFLEIGKRRQWSESGPLPITFSDIQAWGFCFAIQPTYLQVKLICRLDEVWLEAYRKVNK